MSATSDRPNILILLTDQQRYDTIAAAGHPHMITPNLDRLVREGCLFDQAHSPNPICVPARHDLLTGAPGHVHGYFDNSERPIADPGTPTLPGVFARHGYRTALIGKGHFHPPTTAYGYQETLLMEEIPKSVDDDAYLQFLASRGLADLRNIHGVRSMIYHEPQAPLMNESDGGTRWVGQRAAQWIADNGDASFLLSCHWIAPHPPWTIPANKSGLYANRPLPGSAPGPRGTPFPKAPSTYYGDDDSPEEKRRIREAYYTSVTMVDEAVGLVLQALEQRGLLDKTLILFTSDHGEMLQDKGFYQKALPYEGSVRIPFVVRYPRLFRPESRCSDFVDLLDVFPTCLDAAGLDYPQSAVHRLHGGSVVPDTQFASRRDPAYQFCNCMTGRHRWVMTRNTRYKYIYFFAGPTEYLFDLVNDPHECHNLLPCGGYPEDMYRDLKSRAIQSETERGAGNTIDDGDFTRFPGTHPPFDWNNGDKYPRWCYGQFPTFGQSGREAELFLKEWDLVTADWHDDRLNRVPMPEEGKQTLIDGFSKLGGDANDLLGRLKRDQD